MKKSPIVPTQGRIVHYVLKQGRFAGMIRAAMITLTWPGEAPGSTADHVNLSVFLDLANDPQEGAENHATSARYSEDKEPGTWHWMPFQLQQAPAAAPAAPEPAAEATAPEAPAADAPAAPEPAATAPAADAPAAPEPAATAPAAKPRRR